MLRYVCRKQNLVMCLSEHLVPLLMSCFIQREIFTCMVTTCTKELMFALQSHIIIVTLLTLDYSILEIVHACIMYALCNLLRI